MSTSIKAKKTAITIIGFARPDHTKITLDALKNNEGAEEADLHIFLDGARDHVRGEKERVEQTQQICQNFMWAGRKTLHVSAVNQGLKSAVKYALDTTFSDYESAVIVEDDIATSPYFYKFATEGLKLYQHNNYVGAVCGHCYPSMQGKDLTVEPFFLRHFGCWGWASWRRTWENICWDTGELLERLAKSRKKRILDFGNGNWVSGILEAEHRGQINTWDVQVGTSIFLNGQMCLFPPETLTNNIGWRAGDITTHHGAWKNINAPLAYKGFVIPKKQHIEESVAVREAIQRNICPPHVAIKNALRAIPVYIVRNFPPATKLNEIRKSMRDNKSKEIPVSKE